jgi:plastocyanin
VIRRYAFIGLALLALCSVARLEPPAADAAKYPARLMVSSDEFRITLSRAKVPAGRVKIEHVNYGEDPHDLKLQRIGGTRVYSITVTPPGEHRTKTFRLRAGRYHVWCAVGDHRAKGMHAILRVVRS